MVKNSAVQNDFVDKFSRFVKVNEVTELEYPIIYNCFSFGTYSVFVLRDRKHFFKVCGVGLDTLGASTIVDFNTRQYNCHFIENDYSMARLRFRGLCRLILDKVP